MIKDSDNKPIEYTSVNQIAWPEEKTVWGPKVIPNILG